MNGPEHKQRVAELLASMDRIAAADAPINDGNPTFSVLPFKVIGNNAALTIEPCEEDDPGRTGWGVYERDYEVDDKAKLVSVHPTPKEAGYEADRLERWDGAPFNLEYQGENYTHQECLHDFAGNWKSPGCWADLWRNGSGQQLVTLGGGWEFFLPGGDKGQLPIALLGNSAETAIKLFKAEPPDAERLHTFLAGLLEPMAEQKPGDSNRNPIKP